MRIIAGRLRGRRVLVPPGSVRPTADRVREAWMNVLAPELPGARVLDLWAGSGALGLEALSRGAAEVTFVERDPRAVATIRANLEALAPDAEAQVWRRDALRVVRDLDAGAYDVVVADPPYDSDAAVHLVGAFRQVPFGRILSVEHDAALPVGGDTTRRYGSTALTFCQAP